MSIQRYVDLHTHTTASDGTNAPSWNVKLAKEAGLAAIAITDHDTVAGLAEAIEEGNRIGIQVVPGVEISTVGQGQDIHVLGYYIDYTNELFLVRLEQLRDTRNTRNAMMISKLNELGLEVTLPEVLANLSKSSGDETIGRPHIAEVLLRKGYVQSMSEAFERYLGNQGLAYVNPPRITPQDAIQWIREAGGKAVLAHPGLYQDDDYVEAIINSGIDGMEVYHSDHTPEQEQRYKSLAEQHRLIITGGSDYHGERNGIAFHAELGARRVDTMILKQLQT